VLRDAPLAPYTTFRVGGPADWLVLAHGADDVKTAVAAAKDAQLPVTVIGGGSNLLVADAGVRGVVIRVHGGDAAMVGDGLVRADAGLTINGLVRWTINHGLAGLEAWAGTPGTVGGAVHGNAHFKGRLIGELVDSVELLDPRGGVARVPAREMAFAYDASRLQHSGSALSADVAGDARDPRRFAVRSRWHFASGQPLESRASCIFQNPDPRSIACPRASAVAGALVVARG
jgi:UDP-N-acetylmuramate dehydrogenase